MHSAQQVPWHNSTTNDWNTQDVTDANHDNIVLAEARQMNTGVKQKNKEFLLQEEMEECWWWAEITTNNKSLIRICDSSLRSYGFPWCLIVCERSISCWKIQITLLKTWL